MPWGEKNWEGSEAQKMCSTRAAELTWSMKMQVQVVISNEGERMGKGTGKNSNGLVQKMLQLFSFIVGSRWVPSTHKWK